jgi:hypothetical protein
MSAIRFAGHGTHLRIACVPKCAKSAERTDRSPAVFRCTGGSPSKAWGAHFPEAIYASRAYQNAQRALNVPIEALRCLGVRAGPPARRGARIFPRHLRIAYVPKRAQTAVKCTDRPTVFRCTGGSLSKAWGAHFPELDAYSGAPHGADQRSLRGIGSARTIFRRGTRAAKGADSAAPAAVRRSRQRDPISQT